MGRVIAVFVTAAIVPFGDRLLCDAEGLRKKWRWFSTRLNGRADLRGRCRLPVKMDQHGLGPSQNPIRHPFYRHKNRGYFADFPVAPPRRELRCRSNIFANLHRLQSARPFLSGLVCLPQIANL